MAGVADRNEGTFIPADVPVLVLHGDLDPLIDVAEAKASYSLLKAPRYFVTLLGGGHAGPFEDAADALEAKVPGHDQLITASTLAFWDQHLLEVDPTHDEILGAIDQDGLTTVEFELD